MNKILTLFLAISFVETLAFDKSIIGEDQRVQVSLESSFEYDGIGLVGTYCSGFLVAPNIVMTAAHCVYSRKYKKFVETNYFKLGPNNKAMNLKKNWKKIYIGKKYKTSGSKSDDIAFIVLKDSLIHTETFTLKEPSEASKIDLQIAGYPSDKEYGTMWMARCHGNLDLPFINHYCDTISGMSGSPIYSFDKYQRYAHGIHVLGDDDQNRAISVNSLMISSLKDLKKGRDISYGKNSYWVSYINKSLGSFLPEYDRIYLSNTSAHPLKLDIIYYDNNKEQQQYFTTLKSGQQRFVFNTRKSKFYYRKLDHDPNPTNCKKYDMEELNGSCYHKMLIKSANWKKHVFILD